MAVTPASVPLDEDTPPSPELLDFDTEKFLMGIDLSPGPEEDFSEEELNTLFTITSPKRKRAVSGGGDATEARLNTTATPSAAQAFLHSDHPPQSLAQSAGAAVTGESENAAPAAVAKNDKRHPGRVPRPVQRPRTHPPIDHLPGQR